jgi:hypothetical protein
MLSESTLLYNKHMLFCIGNSSDKQSQELTDELNYIKQNFCGILLDNEEFIEKLSFTNNYNTNFYFCGDINKILSIVQLTTLQENPSFKLYLIKNLAWNYETDINKFNQIINSGEVPINIHKVGVYFRNLFDSNSDYFEQLNNEHQFQVLKESNKPSESYRKGIYLSKVEEIDNNIHFNLLRCSTNFNGPTDNFRNTDTLIVNKVNEISERFFDTKADLNHVLAQVYFNSKNGGESKNEERKAKIKEHSDKTKDMPRNGLMAFCTFYKDYLKNQVTKSKNDPYDYVYKGTSVLTILRFRLKSSVNDDSLVKKFDIVLYPNSVLIMSLETNRLYTHEIVPSVLPVDLLPTRLGYVIRSSKTKSVFKDGQTYIVDDENKLIKLEKPTPEDIQNLRKQYYKENISTELMNYENIYFSMNDGDYKKPII